MHGYLVNISCRKCYIVCLMCYAHHLDLLNCGRYSMKLKISKVVRYQDEQIGGFKSLKFTVVCLLPQKNDLWSNLLLVLASSLSQIEKVLKLSKISISLTLPVLQKFIFIKCIKHTLMIIKLNSYAYYGFQLVFFQFTKIYNKHTNIIETE